MGGVHWVRKKDSAVRLSGFGQAQRQRGRDSSRRLSPRSVSFPRTTPRSPQSKCVAMDQQQSCHEKLELCLVPGTESSASC